MQKFGLEIGSTSVIERYTLKNIIRGGKLLHDDPGMTINLTLMHSIKSQAEHLENVLVLEGDVVQMPEVSDRDPTLKGSVFDWRSIQRCIVEIFYLCLAA